MDNQIQIPLSHLPKSTKQAKPLNKNQQNNSHHSNSQFLQQNSQIHLFKFKLVQQTPNNQMKPNHIQIHNNSTHSLLSMKDYRKPTISREKQFSQIDRSKGKNANFKQQYERKHSKPISFKAMSDNLSCEKKSRNNNGLKQKNALGVQINELNKGNLKDTELHMVTTAKNGQNLATLSSQHEPTPKIQRTTNITKKDGKKSRKISKLRPDDDLDLLCNQDLSYHLKKTPKSETVIKQKYIEKPLVLQSNISTKSKSQVMKFGHNKIKQKSLIIIDPKQAIDKFEKQANIIKAEFDYESLIYLDARQQNYLVNSEYITRKQKNFTWVMRAVLVQWIMQVCYQFSLKRETFYISVNIVDRFLQKQPNLLKSDFQLVGAASMFIASKLQQQIPKSSQMFVRSANGSYSAKQIKQMEIRICKVLKYQINPPTIFRWGNLLMTQWDNFLKQDIHAQNHPLFANTNFFYFKQPEEDAYMHFRQLTQLLDCSILQIQTYQYNPKLLVCAFMYLVLCKNLQIYNISEILSFQTNSLYLVDQSNLLNDLFEKFLQLTFTIRLRELHPIIQYSSSFFNLPNNYDEPVIPNAQEAEQTMQLEQYCSFQPFDKNMLIIVKKRFRGVYLDR